MLRKPSFAAPLALLLAFTGVQYARGIIIDDFSAGELVIDGPATQDQTGIDPAHVIGGSRRIQLGQFGNGSHIEIADDLFKFSSAGWGYTTLTYGAVESLGGLDLTQNGHDRFRIKFGKVTTKYTPMALYVNLSPNSSSNGIQWTAKQEWDGSTFEIPFANFPSTLTTVHKIVFDAFRNQAGTEFEIESISTAGPSLAGDFNRDGAVNADDLEVWQQQSGMDTRNGSILRVIATADANLDGRVDGADFLAWQRTVGGQTTPAIAIPEPASLLTALATAFALTPLLRTARRNC
jgi:hypothetical protein